MKNELDHLTIPNDGTDVWEIDPKHLKYGTQIASASYGELEVHSNLELCMC
jgi:hypothetical protein